MMVQKSTKKTTNNWKVIGENSPIKLQFLFLEVSEGGNTLSQFPISHFVFCYFNFSCEKSIFQEKIFTKKSKIFFLHFTILSSWAVFGWNQREFSLKNFGTVEFFFTHAFRNFHKFFIGAGRGEIKNVFKLLSCFVFFCF